MFSSNGDLAAVEVAFFSVTLLSSIYVLIRHGFDKQQGWLYIAILSILRIIGSSATLYMQTTGSFTTSAIETAGICSSVGTAPLLLALMGFLSRIHTNMDRNGISMMIFRPLQLTSLAALIIAIIGGTDTNSAGIRTGTGSALIEAASVMFLGLYVALAAITAYACFNFRHIAETERYLFGACIAALPCLLVRVIFTVFVAFAKPGSAFYWLNVNIYITAFMQFLMEALVCIFYLIAGYLTPQMEKPRMAEEARASEEWMLDQRKHTHRSQQSQRPRFQRPERLGDYRPSRIIINALSDRR